MADNPPETVAAEGKKPTVDKSFEVLLTKVEKYDEELVKGWKEDIDTLLVFGGLFSAVVTAFLIEAYQKLEEDPADKTVALLEQLVSLQQPNTSETPGISSNSSPFTPDPSTIRINCFWLLSLIFSLTSALFGLLCKQWIREFQRYTPTSTTAEALALRQLRRDSFERWNVPAFLAALPILLEIVLILFFVGILDLLWGLHRIPFIVSLVAVGLSAGLYFITTLLPTLTIPKDQKYNIKEREFEWLSYQFICPYKSPQAWLFYRFVCKILRPLSRFWNTSYFESEYDKPAPALRYHIESPASDWSSFDLRVVRQYDQHAQYRWEDLFSLQVYQLRAFEWAVMMFRDSPLMIPHLQNVLGTMPPSVVMSAVLGHWDVALWSDVSKVDVDLAVRDIQKFARQWGWLLYMISEGKRLPHIPAIPDPAICQPRGIKFLFGHQYLMIEEGNNDIQAVLERMGMQTAGFHFVVPLSVSGRLWPHPDAGVRKRSLALLQLYKESWKSCSSVENDNDRRHLKERIAFTSALAKHINRTDHTSVLITSKHGREFIRFIHHEIITQWPRRQIFFDFVEWLQAIERTQEVGNLPPDYFAPIPSYGLPPVLPPLPPSRYSLETVELDHDNEAPGSQLDPPLPSGWEQLTTPEGRPYFFDRKIGTVTWEDPRQNILMASGSQLDGPLPSGWVRKMPREGRPYFFHNDTRTATWLDPRRYVPAGGQGNPQASGSQLDRPLPPSWEQRTVLGTPYFIDLNTHAVFWKDPRQIDPAHQVAESSGSGNLQASGSQHEGRLPFGWGQGTFLDTPYFFDRRTHIATWKDPRQRVPAGQVAELSGSGIQSPQDNTNAASSRSHAVDSNTDPDSGALSEAGQQSSTDPPQDGAEVEASSGISSSDSRVDVHTPLPFNSSATNHPAQSLDPLAPLVPLTLRTDDLNRDTEVSSPQDDGETLDIQTIKTSGDTANAGHLYAPGRGHTGAGGTSGSSGSLAEDRDDEKVVGSAPAALSRRDIDTENPKVGQFPVSGEGQTLSQYPPPLAVDLRVNEQTILNRSAARSTEEQDTPLPGDIDEDLHPENSNSSAGVTGRGYTAYITDPAHSSIKDHHSSLPGESDTLHLDDSEITAQLEGHSEQDVQSSEVSQREEDVHTTDGGQTTRAHPVDYDESRADGYHGSEILPLDQNIDMRSPNVPASGDEHTISRDPQALPVQVAHTEEQEHAHPK